MFKDIYFFAICAAAAGFAGLLGIRKKNKLCLALSAAFLPVLVFAALWVKASLADISLFLCITAFILLAGLPGRMKK